mgnify:CR=1 FL=1
MSLEVCSDIDVMSTSSRQMNFWRGVNHEITQTLDGITGVVLLAYDGMEFSDFIDILNQTNPSMHGNVLYVSMVRSYNFMKSVLSSKPLKNKQLFFIDCVSGFAFPSEGDDDNCMYHKPPQSLDEMKEIINFGIKKAGPNIIIIDSLTQFMNFAHCSDDELKEFTAFLDNIKSSSIDQARQACFLLYDAKMGRLGGIPDVCADLLLKVEVEAKEDTPSFESSIKLM